MNPSSESSCTTAVGASQLAPNDSMNARIQTEHNFDQTDTHSEDAHISLASPVRSSLPIAAGASPLSAANATATCASAPSDPEPIDSNPAGNSKTTHQMPPHMNSINGGDAITDLSSHLDALRVDSNGRSEESLRGPTNAAGINEGILHAQTQQEQQRNTHKDDIVSSSVVHDPMRFTHLDMCVQQPSSGPGSGSTSHSPSSSGSDATHLTTAQELVPSFLLACPPTIGRTQSCHSIGSSKSRNHRISGARKRSSSASHSCSETSSEDSRDSNHAHQPIEHVTRQLQSDGSGPDANSSFVAPAGSPSVMPDTGLAPIAVGAAHGHKHFKRYLQPHHFHSMGGNPTNSTTGSSSDDSPPDVGPPAPFSSHPPHARQHQSAFQQKRAQIHSKIQALHAQSGGARQPLTVAAVLTSPTFNANPRTDVVPALAFHDLKREHNRLQQQHLQLLKLHHQLQLDHQKLQIVTSGMRNKSLSTSGSHSSSGTSISSNSSFSSSPSSSANNHPPHHSLRLPSGSSPSSSSPDSLAPSSATRGTSAPVSASSARVASTSSPPRLNQHSALATNGNSATARETQSATVTPTVYVSADRASYAQNQLHAKQPVLSPQSQSQSQPLSLHSISTINIQHPPASNLTPTFHRRVSQSSDGSITSSTQSRSSLVSGSTMNEPGRGGQGSTSGLRSMASSSGAASSSAHITSGSGSIGTADHSRSNSDCDESHGSDYNSSSEPIDWQRVVSPLPDVSTDDDLANTMFAEDQMIQNKYREQLLRQQQSERDQDHDNDGERRILPSVSPMSMTKRI